MVLRKIFLLSLTAILCSSSFLQAEEQEQVKKEFTIPTPLRLEKNWWEFFNVTGDQYQENRNQFLDHVEDLLSQLDGEQKETATVAINRLVSNIEALPALRASRIEPPKITPFLDSYTLDEEIELAKQVASIRTSIDNEKKEEKFLRSRHAKISSHLDKLIISYRDLQEETFQKFMLGLEILNTKITLAINEEKLRSVRENKESLEKTLKRSEEELKFSQEHSDLKKVNLNEVKTGLAESKGSLESARNNLLIAELKADALHDNSFHGKLKGSLQQLREYNLSIKELEAELSVLFQEVKLLIGQVHQDAFEGSKEELKKLIHSYSTQLNAIKNQAGQWEQRNDEEFNRFNNIIESDDDPASTLQQLEQQRSQFIHENRQLFSQLKEKIFTTQFILGQLEHTFNAQQSGLARVWTQSVNSVYDCCEGVLVWYDEPLFKVGEQPITVRDIVKGFLVLIFAYFLSLLIRKLIDKGLRRRRLSHGFIYSINRLIHYTIMFLGLIFAFTSVGLDFNRIYIIIGALGVGIGFGLQGIVNNFVSGLIILFTRNFKVGDIIDLDNGGCGSVSAINVQNTIIRSFDGVDIIVPNSNLITSKFVNWTRKDPYKRFRIRFCVDFGTDKDKVVEVVSKAAQNVPATVGQANGVSEPSCWLVEIGKHGLIFELVVYANMYKSGNHGSIGASYTWEVETALRENGFTIPYPSRNIYMHQE